MYHQNIIVKGNWHKFQFEIAQNLAFWSEIWLCPARIIMALEHKGFSTSGWKSRGPEYKPEEGDVLARQHCPAVPRVPSEDTL